MARAPQVRLRPSGSASVMPAASMPGIASHAAQHLVEVGERCSARRIARCRDRRGSSTARAGWKPRSTSSTRTRLRISRPGADQQHAGERDLRDDQRVAHPGARGLRSSRGSRPSARRAASPRRLKRRRQAEDDAGDDRDRQREAERGASMRTSRSSGMLTASSCASARVPATASDAGRARRRCTTARGLRSASARAAGRGRRRAPCGSRSPSAAPPCARAAGSRGWRRRSASPPPPRRRAPRRPAASGR